MAGLRYIDVLVTGEAASAASHYGPRSFDTDLPQEMAQGQGLKVQTFMYDVNTTLPVEVNTVDKSKLTIPAFAQILSVNLHTTETDDTGTLTLDWSLEATDGSQTIVLAAAQAVGDQGDFFTADIDTAIADIPVMLEIAIDSNAQGLEGSVYAEVFFRTADDRAQN